MPSTLWRSCGRMRRLTYMRTPSIVPRCCGTITSTQDGAVLRMPASAAHERWLSSASGPLASTAAIQRARSLRTR
ncbi:MAG: hypothetical protein QOG94_2170 [Solirubrobacteraceae bacterium]|nr:hypothetical protein [Solirubrobacteraceae bacterium]